MNTTPRLFRDAATDAAGGLGGLTPVGMGLGVLQAGLGVLQSLKAKKEMKKLLAQRKAYQTPEEVFQILQATQQNAQSGFDATTLNYLTSQTDQAFSSSLGAISRLGGDPNSMSSLFGQKVNSIMKIGAENHQLQMKNFTQYLGALNSVAENRAAEWQSEENIKKDKMQAAGVNMQAGTANVSGGINTLLSTLSAEQIAELYRKQKAKSAWSSDGLGFNSAGLATGVFQ